MLSEDSSCNDHDLIFIAHLEEGCFFDIHKSILRLVVFENDGLPFSAGYLCGRGEVLVYHHD